MDILKKTLVLLCIALTSAISISCDENGPGSNTPSVSTDGSICGTITYNDGTPAVGVVVSDGKNVVATDESGKYTFTHSGKSRYIYYSIPSNAAVETGSNGLPRFFERYSSAKSEYNFTLTKQPVETKFRLIAMGDPQVKNDSQISRFSSETISDIKAYANNHSEIPTYAITLGDIVGNKWDLYPKMVKAMSKTEAGIPIFQTIGNHDHEFPTANDLAAQRKYEDTFGPTYYSFNRGDVHIISMDDVIHGAQTSDGYEGGFTKEKFQWLKDDLSYVSRDKMVIICLHIPFKDGFTNTSSDKGYYTEVYNLLGEFKSACIIAGHTHNNVTNWGRTVAGKEVHEYVTGTTCGAWWHGTICTDGAPNGFGVFNFDGPAITNQIYKGTRLPENFQMRMYRASEFPSITKTFDGSSKTMKFPVSGSDQIVVNAWNATTDWKFEVYEDGVKTLTSITNKKSYDMWAKHYFYDYENLSSSSYSNAYHHMYYFTLKNSNAQDIVLKATDKWGNCFETIGLTGNTALEYPISY